MVSVLEEGFPHVISRLQACWGRPDRLEQLMSDLLIDRRGDRTGWPLDAWSELNFLHAVHELAYGPPKRLPFQAPNLLDPHWLS